MPKSDLKVLSTTGLSKELDLDRDEVFKIFETVKWIARDKKSKAWILTQKGMDNGGQYQQSNRDDKVKWIVWPTNTKENEIFTKKEKIINKTLNTRTIAAHFNITAQKLNLIFSELGWIEKHPVKGWIIKTIGINNGGEELSFKDTGIPYVVWSEEILNNKILIKNVSILQDTKITENDSNKEQNDKNFFQVDFIDDFRKLHPARYRTMDGHYVRSKAEMIIDNWLYMNDIAHAYERKVPVLENLCSDFFIMKNKVYIEYWGLENNPKYIDNKKRKLKIYKDYGLNLIELDDSDIELLDDKLPKKLLKFNIQSY